MLGLRSPRPSDLYIATPWMWRWAVGDCSARAVWGDNVVGDQRDACECEKRPANDHKNRLFKLGMGGTALSISATVGYTSRCRWGANTMKTAVQVCSGGVNHACAGLDLRRPRIMIMIVVVVVELGSWHKRSQ
jgi:hypothetical protein